MVSLVGYLGPWTCGSARQLQESINWPSGRDAWVLLPYCSSLLPLSGPLNTFSSIGNNRDRDLDDSGQPVMSSSLSSALYGILSG
jgi:hypothetical protein